jgi:hypothetical protein
MPNSESAPRCGKRQGEFVGAHGGGFQFFLTCKACKVMTERVRTAGIAVNLWNEAKPAVKRGGGRR